MSQKLFAKNSNRPSRRPTRLEVLRAASVLDFVINNEDEVSSIIGKNIVTHLDLKRVSEEHGGVFYTHSGTKTPRGLARVFINLIQGDLFEHFK